MTESPAIVFDWTGDRELTDDVPRPAPSARRVPDWYSELSLETDETNTVKKCSPFGDALNSGYLIPFVSEITFNTMDDNDTISAEDGHTVHTYNHERVATLEQNSTYKPPVYRISLPWNITTPPGYSTLIMFPLNRFPLKVKPFSLLIPTDRYTGDIHVPVTDERPAGIIEPGEPFVHVLPVKRSELNANVEIVGGDEDPEPYESYLDDRRREKLANSYYTMFCWEPKPTTKLTDCTVENVEKPSNDEITGGPIQENDEPPTVTFMVPGYYNEVIPEPVDASTLPVPEWLEHPERVGAITRGDRQTFKWMRDAFETGTVIRSTAKSRLTFRDGNFKLESNLDQKFPGLHDKTSPLASAFNKIQFGDLFDNLPVYVGKIATHWGAETSEGCSVLVREPLNHRQGIFRSTSGMVDSDLFTMPCNCISTVIMTDDEKIIPEKTPLNSYLPIKRESLITNAYVTNSNSD